MHPDVRRNFPHFSQLDHVHRRLVSTRSAGTASERTFKFPDRRITRAANGIKRNAGAGFTAMAFDFHPAVAAVEALRDRRGRLRRPAEAFHSDRPCFHRIFGCPIGCECGDHGPSAQQIGGGGRSRERRLIGRSLRKRPGMFRCLDAGIHRRSCRASIGAIKAVGRMYPFGL
jgi:hypothetical protein